MLFVPLQTTTISLGPASLSLPELAQALTKAGMPAVVTPVLRDRGAFVCLKSRSPEAVRRLLTEALDVSFRFDGRVWTMGIDPEAKDRDRLLLVAYKRQAAERAREWATGQDRLRAGRSYALLDRDVKNALARQGSLVKDSKEAAAARHDFPDLVSTLILLQPPAWVVAREARNASSIFEAIERSATASLPASASGLPVDLLRGDGFSIDKPPATQIVTHWSYDPALGLLSAQPLLQRDDRSETTFALRPFHAAFAGMTFVVGGMPQVSIPAEGATIEETFRRMGRPLFEAIPMERLPSEPKVDGPRGTLSLALERLGEAGVEAVMELSPRFEVAPPLSDATGRAFASISLRDALTIQPDPPRINLPFELLWAQPTLEGFAPRPTPARRYPWRAVSREGAWILSNPLAFLDRMKPLSPVPYLVAERIYAHLPKDTIVVPWTNERLLNWSLLEELARALPPGTAVARSNYRGLSGLLTFVDFLPIVRLVAAIPVTQRAEFWRAARSLSGAVWNVGGGTLRLTFALLDRDPDHSPFAQIDARWTGPDGALVTGRAMIDPRGLED